MSRTAILDNEALRLEKEWAAKNPVLASACEAMAKAGDECYQARVARDTEFARSERERKAQQSEFPRDARADMLLNSRIGYIPPTFSKN